MISTLAPVARRTLRIRGTIRASPSNAEEREAQPVVQRVEARGGRCIGRVRAACSFSQAPGASIWAATSRPATVKPASALTGSATASANSTGRTRPYQGARLSQ